MGLKSLDSFVLIWSVGCMWELELELELDTRSIIENW